MEIIDKKYRALPKKKKNVIRFTAGSFFILAIISSILSIISFVEMYLLIVIGFLFSELLKLRYRVEYLENKKK